MHKVDGSYLARSGYLQIRDAKIAYGCSKMDGQI